MGKKKYSTLSTMKSILTDDTKHCYMCGRMADDCHHIFEACDKRWSEEYKLMIPLCHGCHMDLHKNQEMNLYFKQMAQRAFEDRNPNKQFNKIFRRSYL